MNAFHITNVVAVLLGLAMGLFLKNCMDLTPIEKMSIRIPGDSLIRMLQLVSIPTLTTSIVLGVTALTAEATKKIAWRGAAYILLLTIICVCLGLALVLLIKPGVGQTVGQGELEKVLPPLHAFLDVVRNMFPPNPIQACFQHHKTVLLPFTSNGTRSMVGSYVGGSSTLGLIVFSFVAGRILQDTLERSRILVDIVAVINAANRFVVSVILCYFPFGMLFLTANSILEVHDLETFYRLTKFLGVILLGLVLHSVVILPALYYWIVRRNPWTVVRGVFPALLTAWFVTSSTATLPVTLRCCESRNKIDPRITRFMLPIATTMNKHGTALYEAAAAVFVAQFYNINLNMGQLLTIGVASAVSSLGSSALPSAGATTTIFVMSLVGIPAKNAAILMATEWLLDRCNTVVNVLGDCFGVALIEALSLNELGVEPSNENAEEHMQDTQVPSTIP
ncbi:excitatory amino acid transporter 3-like [Gasterosteus aculeatus]